MERIRDSETSFTSDFDHAANFSNYKTFGFPESTGTDRGGYTTLVTSHFKDAVRREMEVRGFTYAESSPDLLVNFYSVQQDKTQIYSSPGWAVNGYWGPYWGYPYWGYPYWYGRPRGYGYYSAWPFYGGDSIDVVQYKSGTLRLDVVDAAHKQVVWEAHVEERLSEQAQDNPQPMISRLVNEMFKKFPQKG